MKTYTLGEYARSPKTAMREIVERWIPTGPRGGRVTPQTEAGWRDSLFELLRESLRDIAIAKETGGWHSRGDIALQWKPWGTPPIRNYVEVKSSLHTTADLDRLISQMDRYRNEAGGDQIFAVICGDNESKIRREFLTALREKYRWKQGFHVYWKRGPRRGVEVIA